MAANLFSGADIYLRDNPDVMAWATQAARDGGAAQGDAFRQMVNQKAQEHYNQFGQNEGRSWGPAQTATVTNPNALPNEARTTWTPAEPAAPQAPQSPQAPAWSPDALTVREGSDFMQNYTNPFEQDVIGAYEKDWGRALKMAQNSNNAQATSQGAFGGSGHGVGTALTNERALDQYGRDVLGAKSDNFRSAMGAGLQDAGSYNQMEGLSANLDFQDRNATANRSLQAAGMLPGMATTQSSLFNNDINNLFAVGGAQQGLGQKSLDLSYDDFMKQWQYPMDMLNWASGLTSGVPTGAETIGKTPTDVGGKMGGAGGLLSGGAALKTALCWVAREVYGADNPQWLVFRSWMLTKAPKWLRNWYIKHGEKTARYISDKPLTKRVIRWFMDRVV